MAVFSVGVGDNSPIRSYFVVFHDDSLSFKFSRIIGEGGSFLGDDIGDCFKCSWITDEGGSFLLIDEALYRWN